MTIESNFHLLELKHYTFLSNFFHSLSTKMETVALGQYDSMLHQNVWPILLKTNFIVTVQVKRHLE